MVTVLNSACADIGPGTDEFFFDAVSPFAFAMVLLAPWIWALMDILKHEFRGSNKVIWLAVVRLVPVFGFLLYVLVGRSRKI
jgi:hypothetical protein